MTLLIISFFAWVLTILAPCILPLLPVILWASVQDSHNKYRPYIIIISLIISVVLFSLLLKATTLFIWVDPIVWKLFSWFILMGFWIITLFPNIWKSFSTKIWISDASNKTLWKSASKKWMTGDILVGMSLGPVFSSCSPTYAIILAIILPISFFTGLLNLFAYAVWLWVVLLAIALLWQKFVSQLKWASDPNGVFKKVLWVIFLLVWISIIFGWDKALESFILDAWYFDITNFEQSILDNVNLKDYEN